MRWAHLSGGGGILYNALSRWGVPIFVMISGSLFIGREIPIKKLYGKYILRIVVAYLFWSTVYAVVTDPHATLAGWVMDIVQGSYHMWFLYMIIGLYISQPILNQIAKSKQLTEYFICIAAVTSFLFPQIIAIAELGPYPVELLGGIVSSVNSRLRLGLFGGFAAYFLLGHYLRSYELTQKKKRLIYLGGIIGLFVTVIGYSTLCLKLHENNEIFLDNLSINLLLVSTAIFVLARENKASHRHLLPERMLSRLSDDSFGIYLVHVFVIRFISPITSIVTDAVGTFISIPLMALVVFATSLVAVEILKRIPILSRYIV